jgi:hypothetical protein
VMERLLQKKRMQVLQVLSHVRAMIMTTRARCALGKGVDEKRFRQALVQAEARTHLSCLEGQSQGLRC